MAVSKPNPKHVHNYVARNQFGDIVFIKQHPRKELMKWAGRTKAHKMFVDLKDGSTIFIGYIVGEFWFDIYGLEGVTFAQKVSR